MKEIQTNRPDAMPGDAAGHVDDEFGGFALDDAEPDGDVSTGIPDEGVKIVIDDEFKTFIPPQTAEEHQSLETSLRTEGCRDALVVWPRPDGTAILLDGHTRKKICDEHVIPYRTVSVSLPDRDAARDWIDKNQLSRRNLTPEAASEIRGRIYERAKQQGARTDLTSGNSYQKFTTAETIAKQHGVSEKTVRNDAKLSQSLKGIEEVSSQAAEKIRRGEVKDARTQLPKLASDKKALHAVAKGIEKGATKVKAIIDRERDISRVGEQPPKPEARTAAVLDWKAVSDIQNHLMFAATSASRLPQNDATRAIAKARRLFDTQYPGEAITAGLKARKKVA